MATRKKDKDAAAQAAALEAAQQEMNMILGTRLDFQQFDELMYSTTLGQESEQQAGQVLEEVFEAAWTRISNQNVQQLLVPYASAWALDQLGDVIHCHFLDHDAGELSESGWSPDQEPTGSHMDAWSRGVLEVKKPKQVKKEEEVVAKKPRSRRGGARSTRSTVRSNRGGLRVNSRGSRMGTATPTYRVTPSAAKNAAEDDDDQIKLRKELEEEKKAAERRRKLLAAEEKRDQERATALQRELKNKQFTFDSKGNILVVQGNDTHRMRTMDKINVKISVSDSSTSGAANDSADRKRKSRRSGTGIMKNGGGVGGGVGETSKESSFGGSSRNARGGLGTLGDEEAEGSNAGLHVTSKGLQALRATQNMEAKTSKKKKKGRKKKDYFEPQTDIMPSAGTSIRVAQGVTFREGGVIRTGPQRSHVQSNWSKEEYRMLKEAEEQQLKAKKEGDDDDDDFEEEAFNAEVSGALAVENELKTAQRRAREERERRESEKSKKNSMYGRRNTPTPPPVKSDGPQPIIRNNLKVTMANSKKRVTKFKSSNSGTIKPVAADKLSLLLDDD